MIAFIDDGIQTKETMKKWRSRREQKVKSCKQQVPPCLAVIYGDMLKQLGVPVFYSVVDNDDTMAAYAQNNFANILSGDKDFFRYLDSTFPIYSDFVIQDGCL